MRYINLDQVLEHPDAPTVIGASERVRALVLKAQSLEERKALIAQHRPKWVAYRTLFEDSFGATCWYTECENPGTDDDVDHFRPKGGVAGCDHDGYWWEAFNWHNYRLSCHRANRIRTNPDANAPYGKGDHFPLLDEGGRWHDPDLPCHELPELLDPTDPADPPLLSFNQDGYVAIATHAKQDATAQRRFDASRTHLHLDWPALVTKRRGVFTQVWKLVTRGDRFDARLARDPEAKTDLKEVSRDLIALAQAGQPFSSAAATYIRVFRDRPWIQANVLPHIPGATQ